MRFQKPSPCLTRVFVDDRHNIELAELRNVIERVRKAVSHSIPHSHQKYVGNALINLAVCRMLCDVGAQGTATILISLVDSVHDYIDPPSFEAAADHAIQYYS